jgi:hypothetical protein
LLAELIVGSTKTRNVDVDVAEPALPAAMAATENTNASAAAMRLIVPFSPLDRKRLEPSALAVIVTSSVPWSS